MNEAESPCGWLVKSSLLSGGVIGLRTDRFRHRHLTITPPNLIKSFIEFFSEHSTNIGVVMDCNCAQAKVALRNERGCNL